MLGAQPTWEQRNARRAALAALVGAAGLFGGTIWRGAALSDMPRSGVLETLDRVAQPGPVGPLESLRVATFEFYDERASEILGASFISAIGYLAIGFALTYLAVAVAARRPQFPRILTWLPLAGAALQAISTVLGAFGANATIRAFLDGQRTVAAVEETRQSGLALFASLIGLPGALALAMALVFVALNAMRVGLLTRFLGVLGIITGVLQILPIGGPMPIVEGFWLILLAALFAGLLPGGRPPAWSSGKAEPWPTGSRRRPAPAAAGGVADPVDQPVAQARANKRKRKRR